MQPSLLPTTTTIHPKPIFDELAGQLIDRGWHVIENYFDTTLIKNLVADLKAYDNDGELTPAGIGRGIGFTLDENIRGDKTRWLTRSTDAQKRYLDEMEMLRHEINRLLFMGLFEYESHFACYEPGAYYLKHRDSFRGAAGRILTTVAYLNETWQNEDGGFLAIYNPNSEQIAARIKPSAGTLVVFLSEDIPHEVEPTQRQRLSIAGWFKCNTGKVI